MGKLQKNQKGFTAVEGLLIVLILVVIGAVGYMVYHNDHKTKTVSTTNASANKPATSTSTKTSTTTTSTPSQSATPTTATIKVPELGIEFTVPSAFSDITYHYSVNDPSGNQPISGETFADLSTTALDNLDSSCVANSSGDAAQGLALGMLVRGTGQGQAGENFTVLKQFNGYFIGYASPQDGCSSSSAYETDTSGFTKAIDSTTITAIN